MKIYMLQYALDEYIDGRMEEETQLFSSLDNAFKYCELKYGINREQFGHYEYDGKSYYYYETSTSKWNELSWNIIEEILDECLTQLEELQEEG